MISDAVLIAGIAISAGRKPITFAALDNDLNIVRIEKWEISEVITYVKDYDHVRLAIDSPATKSNQENYSQLLNELGPVDFQEYSERNGQRLWIPSNAEKSYKVYQPVLFLRQTLVGRLQRALILYDEGLQIDDPMDFFEEITRHKILQGILPTDNIYSSKELDALMMAYVAWLAGSPAERVVTKGAFMLPKLNEND